MPFEKLIQVIGFQPKENASGIFVKKYAESDIKSEFYNYTPWLSSKITG